MEARMSKQIALCVIAAASWLAHDCAAQVFEERVVIQIVLS